MSFWEKVNNEIRKSNEVSRKLISFETGISVQTINRAMERDSRVYLDVAMKIAKIFNKPIEFFLEDYEKLYTGNTKYSENKIKCINQYYKYADFIEVLEKLDEGEQKIVLQLAKSLEEKN